MHSSVQNQWRCVVDTNVTTTANGINSATSQECVAASARALQTVMSQGHVFIDDDGRIISEYRKNLNAKGEPGPGDAFLRWLLTNEWNEQLVTHVKITPRDEDSENFIELPIPPEGIRYDRSDQKFLAVAAAHPEHPPILQSFDSKWWGWREALNDIGITIIFLCQEEIVTKHKKKSK